MSDSCFGRNKYLEVTTMSIPSEAVLSTAKKFLHYSLSDVNYTYDQLTDIEKRLVTEDEFKELTAWLRTVSSTKERS